MEQKKKRIFMGLALICITGLCVYGGIEKDSNAAQAQTISEGINEPTESENPSSKQTPWQVYIRPDMPEPYTEVLKQYESFINAGITDINAENVREKLWGGEWKYVYDELGGAWLGGINRDEKPGDILCYALEDLTGDGFPELIMARGTQPYPYVIYNYTKEKGVEMGYLVSSYFSMTICETGILKVVSAGAYSTTTYLQYQEDVQDWVILDKIAVQGMWDSAAKEENIAEYFKLAPGEKGDPDEPIPEEEYRRIEEKYAAAPMKLKWNPLVYDKTNPWYSYEEDEDFIYEHDFMSSQGGQGFHWWIYLEVTYIMRDYGRRIGYDFMSDRWTVEHIWPIEGGYYNILLSQDNHDVVLDLLCQPGQMVGQKDRKYVILYALYEDGDRGAGYNDVVSYASQLEWVDYDFYGDCDCGPVENPFGDLYETSIYLPCCLALYQYEQETGYDGKWHIRQIYGRSPFWDYLVESENGFLWICTDLDYYTYVLLNSDN